ncbi:MAG: FAD:protein FMN transferase [Pirellulales bacterium]
MTVGAGLRSWLPRVYRLAVLATVAWALSRSSAPLARPSPFSVTLAEARRIFPQAARFSTLRAPEGGRSVWNDQDELLGYLLTTAPLSDTVVGYTGPSNTLLALDRDGRVVYARLLSSGDTPAHVAAVERATRFWTQLTGWIPRTDPPPQPDAISGSTLTSLAIIEGVERRLTGETTARRFPQPLTWAEVRRLIPAAAHWEMTAERPGWLRIDDAQGRPCGFIVRTSPHADHNRGYRGPSESLVAIATDGATVTGVALRSSYDTPEYVERVRADDAFFRSLAGRSVANWAVLDFQAAGIEGVSGATQTSYAVADGLRRRFAADPFVTSTTVRTASGPDVLSTASLLSILVIALLLTFSRLRSHRTLRWIWNAVLVLVFAAWLGDLVSLALLAGWARQGIPAGTAPATIALVAVALLVPWTTRQPVYCQRICPHGAAQFWLGRWRRLHVPLPPRVQQVLSRLPALLLVGGAALAIVRPQFDLTWLEPFDAWVLGAAATVSAVVALTGLAASLVVPHAYCRFGCPTGALLKFVRGGGSLDRWRWRDATAGCVALAAVAAACWPASPATSSPSAFPQATDPTADNSPNQLQGRAFGTTWSIRFRAPVTDPGVGVAARTELERIESLLSHWRPESATAQFNSSETILDVEQPAELLRLVQQAQQISQRTDGAYDITVAPLIDAWGFGPRGPRAVPPSDAELAELLEAVGWEKLRVDSTAGTLRKLHPQLSLDLGSLLQGYAADQLAAQLRAQGYQEFLINVGGELLAQGVWTVAIENPWDPSRPLRTLRLENAGLATSGVYRSRRAAGTEHARFAHHLISPRTGQPYPVSAELCAVVAPTALEADAWATALLAIGPADGSRLAQEQGVTVIYETDDVTPDRP